MVHQAGILRSSAMMRLWQPRSSGFSLVKKLLKLRRPWVEEGGEEEGEGGGGEEEEEEEEHLGGEQLHAVVELHGGREVPLHLVR